jgi:hypothetical protein
MISLHSSKKHLISLDLEKKKERERERERKMLLSPQKYTVLLMRGQKNKKID